MNGAEPLTIQLMLGQAAIKQPPYWVRHRHFSKDLRPSSRYRLSVSCQSDRQNVAGPARLEPATPGLEGEW